MEFIVRGLKEAITLIVSGDGAVYFIAFRSLSVSLIAVLLAALPAITLGAWLTFSKFRGRKLAVVLLNSFMAMPPVVVGLVVVLLLARRGPFSSLELLYTVPGMILAQFILALPLIGGLTMSALQSVDPNLRTQLQALGGTDFPVARLLLWEVRGGVLGAVIAAFGRVIAEVGAVIMVGGNIKGATRLLTTSIVLETRQGNYETGIALGLILFFVAFIVNAVLSFFQHKASRIHR